MEKIVENYMFKDFSKHLLIFLLAKIFNLKLSFKTLECFQLVWMQFLQCYLYVKTYVSIKIMVFTW